MKPDNGRKGFKFVNWATTYGCQPELYFEPKDVHELRQILGYARVNKKNVKVIGNSHSPSDIACTDGYMISMKNFNKVLQVDTDKKTVKAESGVLISDLNRILEENGLAFGVLCSISDITLVGAISTATHGTGLHYSILSAYVLELEMVCADGSQLQLSREKDLNVFLAACASLGALGVITSITFQCEPVFRLHQVHYSAPLKDVLENLEVHLNSSDHFRFYWYPHTDQCAIDHIKRTDKPISRKQSWFWDYAVGFALLQFLYWLSVFVPSIVPWINRTFYWFLVAPRKEVVDKSYNIFNFDCLFQQYVSEWAIPIEETANVLCQLKAWIDNNFYAHFPIELRFSKGDDLYLSPSYQRDSCYINIIMYRPYGRNIPKDKYWKAFEEIVLKAGGRPHWAKDHTVQPHQLEKMYPCWNKFLDVRSRLDPEGMFLNDNLRRIFGL